MTTGHGNRLLDVNNAAKATVSYVSYVLHTKNR